MPAPVRFTSDTFFREDEVGGVGGVAGRSGIRTPMLDALFSGLKNSTDQICNNLALIQRDDGRLRDGVVPTHAVDAPTMAYLASVALSVLRGPWVTATAYALKDIVTHGGQSYACLIAHTSALFADALAAGYWGFILASANHIAGEFSVIPSGGIIETNIQTALVGVKDRSLLKAWNLTLLQNLERARENLGITQAFIIACSNETVQIPSGPAKVTMRAPFSFAMRGVRASLSTAGTTPTVVDVNRNGVSVLSTKLSIAATQKTSQIAATPAVISNTDFAQNDEITIDIDTAGAGAKGLKVTLLHQIATVEPDVPLPLVVLPPGVPPAVPPGVPATMIFWSGFGSGVSIGDPYDCYSAGCWQDLRGRDTVTGFTWPPNVGGGGGRFQARSSTSSTPETLGDYIVNDIALVTGRLGTDSRVCHQLIKKTPFGTGPQGEGATQDAYLLEPLNEVGDLYISFWRRLDPTLLAKLGNQWFVIFEWKSAGDYRVIVNIVNPDGTPYWEIRADNVANGGLTDQEFWRVNNTTVPVPPMGDWFKFEVYWHRSHGADGRVWMAVNGQQIVNRVEANYGVNNAQIERIFLMQLYTGASYPVEVWTDDVQIWSGFPVARAGDPWYDGVYGHH